MTDPTPLNLDELTTQELVAVEDVCTKFEQTWQQSTGEGPLSEDCLGDIDEPTRSTCLAELLALELVYRRRSSKPATLEELNARFPNLDWIADLFERFGGEEPPTTLAAESRQPHSDTLEHVPSDRPEPTNPVAVPGYVVLGELGRGGMGIVYKAKHLALDRTVALKVIRPKIDLTESDRERFEAEAKAVARLQHSHIVEIFEVGQQDGNPYFSLEYCSGGTLAQRLRQAPLSIEETASLLEKLARATEVAHREGIIHRDLKPDNVLFTADGTPKITDFGLAKQPTQNTRTATGIVMGTPSYMAPEQARGDNQTVSAATDVYALGAILYRCLTGKPPFAEKSTFDTLTKVVNEPPPAPREIDPSIPIELETICLRCLEKEPNQRYPSAEVFADDLAYFLRGERLPLPTPTWGVWLRWHARTISVAGLVIVALFALWRFWPSTPAEPTPTRSAPDPLEIRPLTVFHFANLGDEALERGRIGQDSFSTKFGDAVTITVELSEPGYCYLISFNFDGGEQLLWPTAPDGQPDENRPPPLADRVLFPKGVNRFGLRDKAEQGLQAFVVVASRSPLPSYSEWTRSRPPARWKSHLPGKHVWEADPEGTYCVLPGQGANRGVLEPIAGAPPLARLCKELKAKEVDAVEAIAFPVLPKDK